MHLLLDATDENAEIRARSVEIARGHRVVLRDDSQNTGEHNRDAADEPEHVNIDEPLLFRAGKRCRRCGMPIAVEGMERVRDDEAGADGPSMCWMKS